MSTKMGRELTIILLLLASLLSACDLLSDDSGEIPPTIASLDTLPTAIFLTENAPPSGFSQFTAPAADINLNARQGWAYTITARFSGTFDDDGSAAEGNLVADIQANVQGEAQRVVLDIAGEAMLPDAAPRKLEGVRFSNDYYLVDVNGICTLDDSGAAVADLNASQLIGGVQFATPTGHQDDLQDVHVWQYGFTLDRVVLPRTMLKLDADSSVAIEATLWVAPSLNAVMLYELTAQLNSARLLSSERDVSGKLYLRYELDVAQFDVPPNISVPHGC